MNITIVCPAKLPVTLYGGTERVVWYLARELSRTGHSITLLVPAGSTCDFATVQHINPELPITEQLPDDADVIHFHCTPQNLESVHTPYIIIMHGNTKNSTPMDCNTVFISKNHAERYGSRSYVYNGLDWNDYTEPQLSTHRTSFHFLGKAAWRVKNVAGAISVIKKTKAETLNVIGGVRFNIKMGIRFTFSPRIRFYGMLGGAPKDRLLNSSKGLLFPVRWHEPFGLSIIESLYFGCPVFGTPYGSLPELITDEVGFLSHKVSDLARAVESAERYSAKTCHEYAVDMFNAAVMAQSYTALYEKVISGEKLNTTLPILVPTNPEKRFLDWVE